MTTRTDPLPKRLAKILTVTGASLELFGSDDRCARRRVVRLCDQGVLPHVRIGPRGDRYILARGIDELLGQAQYEPETRAEHDCQRPEG